MKSGEIESRPVALPAPSPRLATQRAAWQGHALALFAMLWLAVGAGPSAQAQTFTVLHSFAGYPTDGAGPGAGLLMDAVWHPLWHHCVWRQCKWRSLR